MSSESRSSRAKAGGAEGSIGLGPVPALGIAGAALATNLGQLVTLCIYLYCYATSDLPVRLRRRYLHFEPALDGKLYAIGIPAILNLALPSLLVTFLNGLLAAFSQSYVTVLGIYYKLQPFLYLPANGIVQGMRPLVGYNYGAREHGRVARLYNLTLGLSAAIMAIADHRVRLQLNGQIGAVLSLVNGQIGVVLEGHGNLHDEAIVDDPFRLAGRVSLAAGAGHIQHQYAGVFPVGGQPPFAFIDLLRCDEVTFVPPGEGRRAPIVLLTAVGVQLQSGQSGLIRMALPRPYLLRQLGAGGDMSSRCRC